MPEPGATPISAWCPFISPQPVADLTRERAREFAFPLYPTVAEALRCGGKTVSVDAVLIFADPSSDFLTPCIATFQQDGRAVPVFHDGQLPGSFQNAKAAVDAARRLRFPLLAGSSLPVTWRLPAIDLPLDSQIAEALMAGERRSHGLPRARSPAMHGGAKARRRDWCQSRATAGRRCRLESRRCGPLLQGIVHLGAFAQRYAARPHCERRPHPGPRGLRRIAQTRQKPEAHTSSSTATACALPC